MDTLVGCSHSFYSWCEKQSGDFAELDVELFQLQTEPSTHFEG